MRVAQIASTYQGNPFWRQFFEPEPNMVPPRKGKRRFGQIPPLRLQLASSARPQSFREKTRPMGPASRIFLVALNSPRLHGRSRGKVFQGVRSGASMLVWGRVGRGPKATKRPYCPFSRHGKPVEHRHNSWGWVAGLLVGCLLACCWLAGLVACKERVLPFETLRGRRTVSLPDCRPALA